MPQPKRNFSVKQELTGSTIFRPWKEWQPEEYIIGEYTNKVIDKFNKNNYRLRIIESNIDIEEGKVLGLNACGSIDNALSEVAFGEIVQVTYKGMIKLPDGKFKGKDCHTCDVALLQDENKTQEDDL